MPSDFFFFFGHLPAALKKQGAGWHLVGIKLSPFAL